MRKPDMRKPLVSIIIICYNYGKFLPQSIDSALGQTYKNIEIVVINDGSTDNTEKVVKAYIKKHPNIRYVTHVNQGVVKTRNEAIKQAKGEFLIQLDADDWLEAKYVEEVVSVAHKEHADIVYTDYITFDAENYKSNFPDFNIEELKNQNYINVSCLVRRSAIGRFKFDEALSGMTHEDWDFFLGLCINGRKAVKCKTTFLHYRIHSLGRNNRYGTNIDKKNYVAVYAYVIDKLIKSHPDQFNYLSGIMFAHWYIALSNESTELQKHVDKLEKAIQYQKNETLQLAQEIHEIKNSKGYNYIERARAIKNKIRKRRA